MGSVRVAVLPWRVRQERSHDDRTPSRANQVESVHVVVPTSVVDVDSDRMDS